MECFQLNLAAALDSGASLMTIQEDFEGFSVADFDQLVPILKKLQQTTGLAILLNTNSLRALEKLADEVFVFRNGTIAKKLRGEKIAPRTILDHLGGAQAASEGTPATAGNIVCHTGAPGAGMLLPHRAAPG